MNQRTAIALAVLAALGGAAGQANAQYTGSLTQGVSSSYTAYVQGVSGFDVTSLISVGDAAGNGYRMVGLPDGLGAFDNGNGTFTVLMNHELGNTVGVSRAHGGIGSFVSAWTINKSTLQVQSGSDLIKTVYGWDATTQATGGLLSNASFSRFCSADLSPVTAYYNAATGLGASERIFMHGEEGGATGWQMATVATGADSGKSYVLGKFNLATNGSGGTAVGGWENALASPYQQNKTIVIGNNDGGFGIMNNSVAVYVGNKTNTGSQVDRAGLTNGSLKFINVTGNAVEIANATTRQTNIGSAGNNRFTLSGTASTTFSRPEDGAWSADGKTYYFATTDRLDNTELTGSTQVGATRLWQLSFDDIANPDGGGTIKLLIDGGASSGAGKPNMFDNMSVNSDGTITLLEDTGGADHNAKVWQYDPVSGALKIVARADNVRFGDVVNGVFTGPAANKLIPNGAIGYHTNDEETSGVIDVTSILDPSGASGKKYQLFVAQDHAAASALIANGMMSATANATEMVEGGQLMLITSAVPEPQTYAMMLGGLAAIGAFLRRRSVKR